MKAAVDTQNPPQDRISPAACYDDPTSSSVRDQPLRVARPGLEFRAFASIASSVGFHTSEHVKFPSFGGRKASGPSLNPAKRLVILLRIYLLSIEGVF